MGAEEKEEKNEKKKKKKTTHCPLFTYCSALSRFFFFKWLLQVSLRGNIYSYHNAAYTHLAVTGTEIEQRHGVLV